MAHIQSTLVISTSLISNNLLSRSEIWSLFKHGNLTTGTKYFGKEEELLQRSNFSSFPQYFQNISNFRRHITYSSVKCGCLIYFFINYANPIYRSMDISKYFREYFDFDIARVDSIIIHLLRGLDALLNFPPFSQERQLI